MSKVEMTDEIMTAIDASLYRAREAGVKFHDVVNRVSHELVRTSVPLQHRIDTINAIQWAYLCVDCGLTVETCNCGIVINKKVEKK